MSERLDLGRPRHLQKESEEPIWRPFDEAGVVIFHPGKRAVLRVLAAYSQEAYGLSEIKRLVAEYRNGRALSSSTLSVFLKELESFALVKKDDRQYTITEQGLGFLALYDRAREALTDSFLIGLREMSAQWLPRS